MDKEFLELKGQLKLLKERKLSILDDNKFLEFLSRNNYYRVSGYTLTLRENDEFYSNISDEDVYDIYNCDVEMRNIILHASQIVEINIKSYIAYYYAEMIDKNGYGYKNIENYNIEPKTYRNDEEYNKYKNKNIEFFNTTIQKIDKQIENQSPYELSLQHFIKENNGQFPIWVYVEYMTLTDASILYSLLKDEIKVKISQSFGIFNDDILSKHLHCVSNLRNLCAHNYRLYGRVFKRKPSLSKAQKENLYLKRNDKLFSYFLVIKQLISNQDEYKIVVERLFSAFEKYKRIDIHQYGFPDNWKEIFKYYNK